MQKDLNENHPGKLPDGCLHMKQFFCFDLPDMFIRPVNIVSLIETVESRRTRIQMLGAYNVLLNSVHKYAESSEGLAKFAAVQRSEEEEEEKKLKISEVEDIAEERSQKMMRRIANLQDRFKKEGYYMKWSGEASSMESKKRAMEETYLDEVLPDPSIVMHHFLTSDFAKTTEEKMIKAVEGEVEINAQLILDMNQLLLPKYSGKMANRTEILGLITVEDFVVKMLPNCSNPYTPVHLKKNVDIMDPNIQKRIYSGPDGEQLYVSPNPQERDPNDPEPPQDDPNWPLLKGFCITVKWHKTGYKYPAYVFLSQMDEGWLRLYFDITCQYLEAKGMDAADPNRPLFINSRGHAAITNSRGLDLTRFKAATCLPRMTGYFFRRMFINHIFQTKSAILQEYEQFATAHSTQVAKDTYVNAHVKKMKALTVMAVYREDLNLPDELPGANSVGRLKLSKKSEEIKEKIRLQYIKSEREEMLKMQELKDKGQKMSEGQLMTEDVKFEFFNLIIESSEYPVNIIHGSKPLNLFLEFTGDLRYKRTGKITLLRMLDLLPQHLPSVVSLKDHFVKYCLLKKDTVDVTAEDNVGIRLLEFGWASLFMNARHYMKEGGTSNWRIKMLLADLSGKVKSMKYTMGSSPLQIVIKSILDKAVILEEDSTTTVGDKFIEPRNWYECKENKSEENQEEEREDCQLAGDNDPDRLMVNKTVDIVEGAQVSSLEIPGHSGKTTTRVQIGEGNSAMILDLPAHSPVKVIRRRPIMRKNWWSDDMKRQVLKLFIQKAEVSVIISLSVCVRVCIRNLF